MKSRNFISLGIGFSFITLIISGIAMFALPYSRMVATLHICSASICILFFLVHLKNNIKPLKKYLSVPVSFKKKENSFVLNRELWFSSAIVISFILGSIQQWLPFRLFYDFGNILRSGKTIETRSQAYEIIQTHSEKSGMGFEVEVKKGSYFINPVMAIWAEDSLGGYLETLYVAESIATSIFDYGSQDEEGNWRADTVRRPEALPHWSHQRGVKSSDGFFVPLGETSMADTFTSATPRDNFILHSYMNAKGLSKIIIKMEINRSYDWNDYYSKDRFPDDPIYSGSGQNGQPSVIYQAVIPMNVDESSYHLMEPIGHGHHSGQDGELYSNLDNLSTALDILDRIIVKVTPPSTKQLSLNQ